MGPFVLDASIGLSWAFREDCGAASAAASLWIEAFPAHVPQLYWFELRSSLVVNERRGRMSPEATAAFLTDHARLALEWDPLADEIPVLALARSHRLTVYDAAYLELALRLGAPLATLDRALAAAAHAEGVALVGDIP